jgi:hypothetical protein
MRLILSTKNAPAGRLWMDKSELTGNKPARDLVYIGCTLMSGINAQTSLKETHGTKKKTHDHNDSDNSTSHGIPPL